MILFDELFQAYLPWIVFVGILFTFVRLFKWARNKKTGAFIFAAFIQMLMPDPFAERTIQVVQEEKQVIKKEQDESGDSPLKLG
jgi:hypothetical protein